MPWHPMDAPEGGSYFWTLLRDDNEESPSPHRADQRACHSIDPFEYFADKSNPVTGYRPPKGLRLSKAVIRSLLRREGM